MVPYTDNFFAALNSAVFTDGSFCYIPKGVRCPMELSTYFRINAADTGQFERTLIIADEGAYVSYLEGCTAPMRDENQLHAAVVELVALDDAQIKYSTVQNWYPGDEEGKGGIYNFVTKRGKCAGRDSKISWTQVETGSAITWKYPSVHPPGRRLGRRVLLGRAHEQPPAGRHRHEDDPHRAQHPQHDRLQGHLGRPRPEHLPRAGEDAAGRASGARNYTQCDSLLLGRHCGAHTFPYIEVKNPTAQVEHEASTSKIGEDQLFYCRQRGLPTEDAVSMIVNGFCKRGVQGAADGVRGRGAEAARRQPRRERRADDMLEIENLHATRRRQRDPRGVDLEVERRRGPRDHGPERLGQEHAGPRPRRRRGLRRHAGQVLYDGKDLLAMSPEERAREGVFLRSSTRSRSPA